MSTTRRRIRGAATVEMALLMVVLIPIIMYEQFLQDALLFKLDAQETVVTSPFDAVIMNYTHSNGISGALDLDDCAKSVYCDHTSAYDSYKRGHDCDSKLHHTEHGAHQCWVSVGAQELECRLDSSVGVAVTNSGAPYDSWRTGFHNGGLLTCDAQLSVMNKIVINRFLFGQSLAGSLKQFQRNAHDEASGANAANTIFLAKEQFSLLVDPWAVNELDTTGAVNYNPVNPNGSSPDALSRRSLHYYQHFYSAAAESQVDGFFGALGNFVKNDAKDNASGGHDPKNLPVYYKADSKERDRNGGYASGWADSRQSGLTRPAGYPW